MNLTCNSQLQVSRPGRAALAKRVWQPSHPVGRLAAWSGLILVPALAASLAARAASLPAEGGPGAGDTVAAAAAATDDASRPTGGIVLAQGADTQDRVGEALTEEEEPQPQAISGLREVGGVLTPRGVMIIEPALRYSHSAVDRFTFRGIEIIETVLVGVIEAEEADRDLVEASLTARLGITDRFEIEARVPVLYRNDEITSTIPSIPANGEATTVSETSDAFGIGDVEAAMHYQINAGSANVPVFVANLRGKFPTGEGPFDVDRDAFGVEEELPTGSGFYGLEPSITAIYRSDPVVFFVNGGYLINFERDVDERIGVGEDAFEVGNVDPGDAVRVNFGMGFAVNERTSFSLGYSHDYILKTETEIDDDTFDSDDLQVGTVSIGFFHTFTERVGVGLTTEVGATEDATDVSVVLRVPVSLNVF